MAACSIEIVTETVQIHWKQIDRILIVLLAIRLSLY
jgi:hypothetical protein